MSLNEQNATNNVLYNGAAMAVLERARDELAAMGLQCSLGPGLALPEGYPMVAQLVVSTSSLSVDTLTASDLLASEMASTPEGHHAVQERLAFLVSERAIAEASGKP